jgi:glycerophosphoryl diester phosphodiesterase
MTRFGRRDPLARVRRLYEGERLVPGDPRRPLRVVAHRGAARHLPENTPPAFARAMELGADAVETDVCRTRDGVWILWHDNQPGDPVSLARGVGAEDFEWLANWPGVLDPRRRPVYEMTLAEMRAAPCGYSRHGGVRDLLEGDERPEAPFALLDELVAWSAGDRRVAELFIDVKLRPEDAAHTAELEALLDARLRPELVVNLLLPHRELLEALDPLPPRARVHRVPDFELPGGIDELAGLGVRRASFGYSTRRTWGDFTRELAAVLRARDEGELDHITVWTVNDPQRLTALADARVDAVLTDEPALLRRIVDGGASAG